jgi:hypothetical protein
MKRFSSGRDRRSPGRVSTALALLLVASLSRSAAAADLPEEIRRSLEDNARAVSPVTAVWEARRVGDLPNDRLADKLKVDSNFFEPTSVRYVYQEGMYYVKTTSRRKWSGQKATLNCLEESCNLVNLYNGTGLDETLAGGANPVLGIYPVEALVRTDPKANYYLADYFEYVGFEIPRNPEGFGKPITPWMLVQIARGARSIEAGDGDLDGTPYTVVQFEKPDGRRHRVYFDPRLHYAMCRREVRSKDGALELVVINSDFTKFEGTDLRLPRRCRVEHYTHRGQASDQPLYYTDYRVKELNKKRVRPEQFVLNYNVPGSIIGDASLPKSKGRASGLVVYRTPARLEDLDRTIREASGEGRLSRTTKLMYVIGAGAAPLLVLGIWLALARRSKAKEVGR